MIQYYTALGRYALRAEEIRHLPIITSPRGASQICVTWYNFFAFRNKKECPHAAALVARRPPIAFTLL